MPAPSLTKAIQTNSKNIEASLQQCSTLDEICVLVPLTFRLELRPYLQTLFALSVKASHVRSVLTGLRTHRSNGTFLPHILGSVKVPAVQPTKEFLSDPAFHTHVNELENQVTIARKALLQANINLKQSEMSKFHKLLHQDKLTN